MMDETHTGTIKWFDRGRGFGFIVPDGGGEELFLPAAQWQSDSPPTEGQRVRYAIQASLKGPIARLVRSLVS